MCAVCAAHNECHHKTIFHLFIWMCERYFFLLGPLLHFVFHLHHICMEYWIVEHHFGRVGHLLVVPCVCVCGVMQWGCIIYIGGWRTLGTFDSCYGIVKGGECNYIWILHGSSDVLVWHCFTRADSCIPQHGQCEYYYHIINSTRMWNCAEHGKSLLCLIEWENNIGYSVYFLLDWQMTANEKLVDANAWENPFIQ